MYYFKNIDNGILVASNALPANVSNFTVLTEAEYNEELERLFKEEEEARLAEEGEEENVYEG